MRKGFLLGFTLSVLACCATLGAAGCSMSILDPDSLESLNADALGLTTGTSFGECLGWCRTELAVDSLGLTLSERSQGLMAPTDTRTRTQPLTLAEWRRVRALVNVAEIEELEGTHGCPDCADGGAEWIEVGPAGERVRVTFEYGAPPAALAALRTELSALRARFPR